MRYDELVSQLWSANTTSLIPHRHKSVTYGRRLIDTGAAALQTKIKSASSLYSLFSMMVSNPGIKSNIHQNTPVQNNGESRNESRRFEREISKDDKDDDHRESSVHLATRCMTINRTIENNPHDKHRHRKRENRRNKVVRGSANILCSRFIGGVRVNSLRDIFVHHVANQSTLGDLKNHLNQQGFEVAGLRIYVTSNTLTAAMYKPFRIITSGNLRKALLDPEI